nr:MAG TPA: Rifin [Caudoviricetes sp.]
MIEIVNKLLPYAKGYLIFYSVVSIIAFAFILTIFYIIFKSIFEDFKKTK